MLFLECEVGCPKRNSEIIELSPVNDRRDEIIRLLDCISANERIEIFSKYYTCCGERKRHEDNNDFGCCSSISYQSC